jgi:hypothetical protein
VRGWLKAVWCAPLAWIQAAAATLSARMSAAVFQSPSAPKAEPSESEWAELCEAQLATRALPHTGLAVTIDLGEAGNVHPRNKQPVGQRLAQWALGDVSGSAA